MYTYSETFEWLLNILFGMNLILNGDYNLSHVRYFMINNIGLVCSGRSLKFSQIINGCFSSLNLYEK